VKIFYYKKINIKNFIIAFTVILLALIEVLDMTIILVALRNIQGAISVSPIQITWTITIYIIMAAICMPISGLFSKLIGRKRLLTISTILFGFSSLLCGLSNNLIEMLIFRSFQGLAGSFLPTIAQSILLDLYKNENTHIAMAGYGLGVMIGPILGPLIGGIVTEYLGWRYIFFINIPICLIALVLIHKFLNYENPIKISIDWIGLSLLSLSIANLQFILDRGNNEGWLDSNVILFSLIITLLTFFIFLIRGLNIQNNIINFEILKDKNFLIASFIMLIFFAILLGTFSWLPLWMESYMSYPPILTGLLIMPRGLACLIIILIIPILLRYFDARILVMIAFLLFGISNYLMSTFNFLQGIETLLLPNIISGISMGMFFVPINSLAYHSLPKKYIHEATGLFNFFRSIGGSIGVAVFSTLISHNLQISWNQLVKGINPLLLNYQLWIQPYNGDANNISQYIYYILIKNSNMIAFSNANFYFSIICFCVIPFVYFIKKNK
jgi:DHA2 family multidrug resistance protein